MEIEMREVGNPRRVARPLVYVLGSKLVISPPTYVTNRTTCVSDAPGRSGGYGGQGGRVGGRGEGGDDGRGEAGGHDGGGAEGGCAGRLGLSDTLSRVQQLKEAETRWRDEEQRALQRAAEEKRRADEGRGEVAPGFEYPFFALRIV